MGRCHPTAAPCLDETPAWVSHRQRVPCVRWEAKADRSAIRTLVRALLEGALPCPPHRAGNKAVGCKIQLCFLKYRGVVNGSCGVPEAEDVRREGWPHRLAAAAGLEARSLPSPPVGHGATACRRSRGMRAGVANAHLKRLK